MKIQGSHIGSIAQGLLDTRASGSVMGATSRGVFLHLASSWVIFLSGEAQHGPLTLNCTGQGDLLKSITHGENAEISPGQNHLPHGRHGDRHKPGYPLAGASPAQLSLLTPDERLEKLRLVAGLAHARQPASPRVVTVLLAASALRPDPCTYPANRGPARRPRRTPANPE